MVGRAISGAGRHRLVLGVALALVLLVVVGRLQLGRPGDMAYLLGAGAGAVVATRAGLVRVDAATNRAAGTLPSSNGLWTAGAGSLWSVDCTSEDGPCGLLRLDPRNLHATARFPLPGVPSGPPVVGEGSAWLLDQRGGWVWRVDLAGGRVVRVRLDPAAAM